LSWDVHLLKFDREAEATFDLGAARRLLERTSGFREVEPGVGEVEGDGYAEIYYGVEASSDLMVAARGSSPSAVIQLICELAAELRMAAISICARAGRSTHRRMSLRGGPLQRFR
jgi:hypothetical protein